MLKERLATTAKNRHEQLKAMSVNEALYQIPFLKIEMVVRNVM